MRFKKIILNTIKSIKGIAKPVVKVLRGWVKESPNLDAMEMWFHNKAEESQAYFFD